MKLFTRIVSLLLIALAGFFAPAVQAQSILDPTDPVITYNPAAPPASPAWGTIGKWVRTVRLGWNTTNFKCYVYNGICFRLRFPTSYNPTANDGKKYPVMIFWHGAGEGGPNTDNEYQLFHGGQIFDNAVSSGTFDGYVILMQSSGGGWGEPAYSYMQTILDYMIANNKVDPFHITANGLSAGGAGTWDWAINYTRKSAGAVVMSAASLAYLQTAPANLKYAPTWLIQGGVDGSPDPSTTIQIVNAMNNVGAQLTYTVFPNDGHDTWDDTWNQPDFWPFMNRAYSANPWPLFGRSQFCAGDPINITVGVTQGFQAYQWRMNGNPLASTTNTINVTQLGTYDCRVENNGIWSDWSHIPLVVSIKQPTVTPNITIPALTSNVVPALDTSHGVTLQVPTGYASYLWQQVGGSRTLSTTNTLTTAIPGNYQVKVTEQFGCSSSFSNPYTVINAAGANGPSPAIGLTITTVSQTALRLDWSVNPSQQYPQTGFEVYQATQSGGPYKIIALRGANSTNDTATGLNPAGKYYYLVRAVNGNAAAAASNEASGTTASDGVPPTAPTNLTVTGTTRSSVGLTWTAATDNVGVTSYDIYVNGVKTYSTTSTSFTVYDLQYGSSYAFSVTARDFAKNISPFSNQVTGVPVQTGYSYKYYLTNGNWNTLQNLSTMTPASTGFSTSLDLSTRTQDINFAYLWEGYLHVPTTGTYYFRTNSDDGSRLWLGGLNQTSSAYNFSTASLVNNDGLHGSQDATSAAITLQAGVYPIAVAFYQQGGGFNVSASWSTPQTGAGNFVPIPLSALSDAPTVGGVAPAAPSNLVATAVSYKKVSLSWSDNSTNETAFEIWRATDSLGATAVTVATVAANKTTFTDSTLNASTRYFYRVRAIGQYGQSAFDNAGPGINYAYYALSYSPFILPSAATLASTLPTATGNVTTISVAPAQSANNFILAFSGSVNIPAAGLYTFYTSSDDGSNLYVDGTDSAHLIVKNDFLQGQTERSGTVTLSAGSHSLYVPYYQAGGGFVVTASIQGPTLSKQFIQGALLGQAFAAATTLALPVTPAAPTVFVSHGTSTASTVTMSWTDNANNEDNYQVYRSANNNANYLLLTTLPANTVSYKDSGLFANATYYYKVRALNQGGNSAFSNEDSAHTADHLPVLAAITAAQYMRFGTQLVLPVTATDLDPETLTIGVTGLPAFGVFTPGANGAGTITFNPATTDQGVYNNITVTVTDQHGGSATGVFSLTVNSNYNPVITRPVANVSVNEKQTATVNLAATDQNTTDALTWTFKGLPGFATPVISGGTAQLTLAPGYADGGSYAVQARIDDGNHGFDTLTFTITVVPVALPTTSTYVHFSDGSAGTLGAAPWNNTAAVPVQNLKFSNLKDQNGTISGLSLTITTPWQNISLPNGTNTYGVNTGNNSGIYPDAVLSSAYYTDGNNQVFKVSGLDTASKYNFTFLGSRGGVSDDRTSIYTVTGTSGTTSVSLQAANNSTNTVSVNNVRPNADSTLTITLAKGASAPYGYINALVITKQFNDHTAPVRSRSISGQFVNGNHVTLTWVASAYNANSYQVYRSLTYSGPYTLLNPGATNPIQTTYSDSAISQNNTYYYYVTSSNSYGVSPSSDTVTMAIPNLPPVLAPVAPITLQANKTTTATVTATDPADVITLGASGLPGFASFHDNGNGSGTLTMSPATSDIGVFTGAVVSATDNHGGVSTTPLTFTVTFANLRNVYINFNDGSASEPAQAAPWNNMNSAPNANASIANMKDDSATATGIGIKLVDTWTGSNNVGPTTGNNSGVYPDNVMQSLYYDGSGSARHINLTGLSSKGKYNVIFYSGRASVTDNRITHYAIGSQTVQLQGASNTSQTAIIKSVSPDATGTIAIAITADAGAPFAYLNAMQLQYSFDTTFYAPTNLVATGPSTSQIALNWVSNAPATTTGFEIWRSASQSGPFTLLATVAGTTTTYTDGGLSTGSVFFYEVRALAGTKQSPYSNIAGGSTVAYTVFVQMNDGSQSPAQGGYWNSINTLMFPGYLLSNMINSQFQQTGITLGMQTNFTGYNIVGTSTGNNTGIYPDNVMTGLYYVNFGDTAKLFVTGLNLTSTYNFNFFGSRVTPPTSVISNYRIGTQVVTLDATNNTTKTVQIAGVHPDSTGTIYFQLFNSDGGRAYLNALTIDGVPSATSTIAQTPVATQAIKNGSGQGVATAASLSAVATTTAAAFTGDNKVSAFPNPFVDEISLSLQLSKPVSKLLVALADVSGRIVYQEELDNVSQGASQRQLSFNAGVLPKGTYFIVLQGLPDGRTRTIQLIKPGK